MCTFSANSAFDRIKRRTDKHIYKTWNVVNTYLISLLKIVFSSNAPTLAQIEFGKIQPWSEAAFCVLSNYTNNISTSDKLLLLLLLLLSLLLLWISLLGAIPMVTKAERAANWRNTHTHVDRTHSLTQWHQHSYNHVVRSASSAIIFQCTLGLFLFL